jgi:hypothetical protein
MSAAADVMAAIMFAFFLVGVTVGIVVVIALAARRADKAARQRHWATASPRTWPHRNDAGADDEGPDEAGWRPSRGGD